MRYRFYLMSLKHSVEVLQLREVGRVFSELPETELMIARTVFEIQKTFLMDNGNIIRNVLSGLIQIEE